MNHILIGKFDINVILLLEGLKNILFLSLPQWFIL